MSGRGRKTSRVRGAPEQFAHLWIERRSNRGARETRSIGCYQRGTRQDEMTIEINYALTGVMRRAARGETVVCHTAQYRASQGHLRLRAQPRGYLINCASKTL